MENAGIKKFSQWRQGLWRAEHLWCVSYYSLDPKQRSVSYTSKCWFDTVVNEECLNKIGQTFDNKMNNSVSWVQERRLRPIYELLDGGNNKKVITEVDRLLKKQHNFSCAKVLKALALIRMNKSDEARELLAPVAEGIPTDDGTIQALSICYRELEEPHLLSAILEAACEKEKSEELLTHCFMAQVRVRDYKKMHITAMQLYKLYNKTTYYGWVVASLFMKSELAAGPLDKSEWLSLELAVRMMEKFVGEQKTPIEDNMLDLYLRGLFKMGKFQQLVEVLKTSGFPPPNWRDDEFYKLYVSSLEQLGWYDELFEYLKSAYLKNPEEYSILRKIIEIFWRNDWSRVNELMSYLLEQCPNRAVVLADLHFCFYCANDETALPRITRDLILAIQFTIDKPSFHSDIMDYFKMVSHSTQLQVLKIAATYSAVEPKFDTVTKIIKDVNYEILLKDFINLCDAELSRVRQANECFGKYLVCDELMDSLRTDDNLRTKESDYHDQYIVLAAANILAEYYKSPKLRDGCEFEEYLKSVPWTLLSEKNCLELKTLKERLVNGENSSPVDGVTSDLEQLGVALNHSHAHFNDKESLVLFAICILEYGLARSPYNYSIRILLSKAYSKFGAVGQAIKVIQGLDLKHVQWDSLGYLIFPQSLSSGTYSEVMKMLTAAESMYTGYKRESMEHIIAAYKYGSFHKIPDFLKFRKALLESTQCGTIFVEKRLLELILISASGSPQDLLKYGENFPVDVLIEWMSMSQCSDNRDFTVLELFDEYANVTYVREATAEQDFYLLQFRMILLFILVKLIVFSKGYKPEELHVLTSCITKYEEHMKLWFELFKKKMKDEKATYSPQFHAIFPPRAARSFLISAPAYILEQLKFVNDILIEKEKPHLGLLQKKIEENSDAMLKLLRENHAALIEDKRMGSIENYIEDFHNVLETFSYTRILLEASVVITKSFYESWKSKGKQKERAAHANRMKKTIGCTVRAILEKFKELHECFNTFINTLKERPLPRLDEMQASIRDTIKDSFLFVAFPSTYDVAQRNIRESHLNQLEEMRKIAANLVEYMRNYMDPQK